MKILEPNFQRNQLLSVLVSNRMTNVQLCTFLVTLDTRQVSVGLLFSWGPTTQPGEETGNYLRRFLKFHYCKMCFFICQEAISMLSLQILIFLVHFNLVKKVNTTNSGPNGTVC